MEGVETNGSEWEFAATRREAQRQWRAFLPRASRYGAERNRVMAGHGNVSRLSPAVRMRLITEDEIVAETLERHAFEVVEKWLQEVCWRRYWKGWLEMRPGVWADYRGRARKGLTGEMERRAAEVTAGRGGVGVMDALTKELLATGYLHNHARMWWASYWIHVEGLPWEAGADFFYRHLLDADAASNTLSWRWVAGLQTPGKTYLVRRSNIERYLEPMADAGGLERLEDGRVTARMVAETADLGIREAPDAGELTPQRWGRAGLWLHEEDLSVEESAELGGMRPAAVAAFWDEARAESEGWSPLRRRHQEAALRDGCARAGEHYGVDARLGKGEGLARQVTDWARREGLRTVVAMRPFAGPLGDELTAVEKGLREAGVEPIWARRESDMRLLPLARKGFFAYWQEVGKELKIRLQDLEMRKPG
jgi:deoxyribodipyrimidine photo-lyase